MRPVRDVSSPPPLSNREWVLGMLSLGVILLSIVFTLALAWFLLLALF